PLPYIQQIFQSIVVPRMVCYKSVSSNTDARRRGSVWVTKALGKVQPQACKFITGALRTTATDTLYLHANIVPAHIRLNRSTFNAAGCLAHLPLATLPLATLPPSNPIHRIVRHCRHILRFHRSPIHHLFSTFPVFQRKFESIDPQLKIGRPPPGILTTRIAPSKERAQEQMAAAVAGNKFCVFTDGSCFEGGVGAAAVVMKGKEESAHTTLYLAMDEHTVFEAEVTGAIQVLDLIKTAPRVASANSWISSRLPLPPPLPRPSPANTSL
ncbi:hypothetical protein DFH07DRAFT_738443, partial [Mycena maculata]